VIGNIKHIVIIESLVDERLTGTEIYKDCVRRRIDLYDKDMTHRFHGVNSKSSLIEVLKYYEHNVKYFTGEILLHFEMHGDSKLKGLVLSNGELIEWEELIDLFRPINIITCNKLFLTMATCNGRFLYKGIDPYKKSPYSGFISASTEVYPDEIVDKFSSLFEQLINNGNLVNAYLEMEKTGSNFYYKDLEASFEESVEFTINDLNNNQGLKKSICADVIKKAKEVGDPAPNSSDINQVIKKVLTDIYKEQKASFLFTN
jgi:hypothetical protein